MDLPKFPKPISSPGRRSKLTPATYKAIITAIQEGNYISAAAKSCGIEPRMISLWVRRGKGEDPKQEPCEPFISFARDVETAIATAEISTVKELREQDDWRAKAWWLERGPVRERWGPNVTITAQYAPAVSMLDALRNRAAAVEENQEIAPLELSAPKETDDAQGRT